MCARGRRANRDGFYVSEWVRHTKRDGFYVCVNGEGASRGTGSMYVCMEKVCQLGQVLHVHVHGEKHQHGHLCMSA